MRFVEPRSVPLRYLLSFSLVIAATAVQFAGASAAGGPPFAAFYPAVAFAFALAGEGPGIVAILGSAGAALGLSGAGPGSAVSLAVFLASAGLIGFVVARLRREREAAARIGLDTDENFALAIESARLGVWRFDPRVKRIFFSETFAQHLGLEPQAGSVGDDEISKLIHAEDRDAVDKAFLDALAQKADFAIDHRVVWPDGSVHWIHGCGRPRFHPDGSLDRVDGVTLDITERKRIEQNYAASLATIQAAFLNANEAIVVIDALGNIVNSNDALRDFCRLRENDAAPATYVGFTALLDMWGLDGRPVAEEEDPYFFALRGKRQTLELKFRRKDTGEEWYGVIGFGSIYGAKGEIIGVVMTGFDITELKQLQGNLEELVQKRTSELAAANQALVELSRHDALTGLFNRLAANERLHAEFMRMKRTGDVYGVLMLDIDYFKNVNDSCGHRVGDEVLAFVARTLSDNLRGYDFIARWGGEEFLVLLPSTDLEGARLVAEKLRAAMEAASHPLADRITVSIGVAVAGPEDLDEDIAVMRADQRLYEAKERGRNRVVAGALDDA